MRTKMILAALSAVAVMGWLLVGAASAAINIETMPVGNAGNTADTTGYGSVAYAYNVGKCEVTNAQYVEFLNAVAGTTDAYGLYNPNGGITKAGSTYSVAGSGAGAANRPVTYVSWYDAIRFANWLTSGNTESGSYTIEGGGINSGIIATMPDHAAGSAAKWYLTSEDEWYKAAYYKAGAYSSYANGTGIVPVAGADSNYGSVNSSPWDVGTGVVEQNGTADMMGNVWEWNETIVGGSSRGVRGGSFNDSFSRLRATYRTDSSPASESSSIGFRVSLVPEPTSIATLCLAGVWMLTRRPGGGRQQVVLGTARNARDS